MKSLFHFSLRETPSASRDQDGPHASKAVESRKSAAGVETTAPPEGLIPASQLPPAADILEKLFREDTGGGRADRDASSTDVVDRVSDERVERPNASELIEREIRAAYSRIEGETGPNPPHPSLRTADHPALPSPSAATVSRPARTPTVPATIEAPAPPADAERPSVTELSAQIANLSVELAEDALERAVRDEGPLTSVETTQPQGKAGTAATAPVASNWAFEEKLAAHKEWVDSLGVSGSRADLSGFDLQHADLISVNLRHADMRDSNLEGADLLLADLRDSCLVRARLNESCLVGANLEGANLEGAKLDTAMGLVASQLAGANLREASLPAQTSEFPTRAAFARNAKTAAAFFTAIMTVSTASALMIWKTKDVQLLGNLSVISFLHSTGAAAALPTAQIFLIAPVVLFILYLVFQFHLQALWDTVLQLPGIFPNGRELGQDSSRIVRGLLRAHFRWMNREAASTRIFERVLALLLGYWLTPAMLFLFWARYLTLEDLHGTLLHEILFVVAFGVALYSTLKVGRRQERWALEGKRKWRWVARLRQINTFNISIGLGVILLFLSVGIIKGAPHGRTRAPQFGPNNIRRWAATIFWSAGYDPYANLTEASLSRAPANWSGRDDEVSRVRGANLIDTNFRYAQGYGIFLVNSHLWHSDFEGAFLSDADLRGSDLGQSTLRFAIMDRARLFRVNLDRSNLDGANLDRADFREANLSYCSLVGSILIDAQFEGASLYGARLSGSWAERASFEKSDLRSSYLEGSRLEHADLTQALLWSAKAAGVDLRNSQLASAIFIDANLQDSDLEGAQVAGTVFSGTNFAGATIDGTDFRGALGLTAAQICSTKSRVGAILTESLAKQVQVECGGPLLAAPEAPTDTTTPQTQVPAPKNASGTRAAR
jgi:uncharacterized protein YjbI with pentapeptide repeats